MKTCGKCGVEQSLEDFHRDKKSKDGRSYRCKSCACANSRKWLSENQDRAKAYKKSRYEDPEYRQKKAVTDKAYALANPERNREASARYRARNPDKKRESAREWARRNPEQGRMAKYKRRALQRDSYTVPFTKDQLKQRMAYYGNKCYLCHEPFEHVDHVKPLSKGGPHMLSNLRPACATCNLSKNDTWPYIGVRV